MQITYNTYTMHLEDEPLEVGYASEKVTVATPKGDKVSIGGHTGRTQLIITLPFVDASISDEVNHIATTLHNSPLIDASCSLVLSPDDAKSFSSFHACDIYTDTEGEFGDMYGVRLQNGPLEGKLAKSLFIVSKDGALFYDEILSDLSSTFQADKALSKLAVAQDCYTGKGCH